MVALFPDDFMFQLTKEEIELVKSQIVTSADSTFFAGQTGGRRKAPYAFTEQGIYMLATVLKGEIAEQQTIFIMRAFREIEVSKFNYQYPSLNINYTSDFHDRFIILDHKIGYHIGASIKDAGKKCFAINTLEDKKIIQDILNRL